MPRRRRSSCNAGECCQARLPGEKCPTRGPRLGGRVCWWAMMMPGKPGAAELLGASVPHLVPEQIVAIASAQAGCPVAVYVLDVDGSCALRLAGEVERFPERIRAPVGVGPELIPEALPQLRGLVADRIGPCRLWPLVVRDRVMGFLLARGLRPVDLEAFAAQAALALELAS